MIRTGLLLLAVACRIEIEDDLDLDGLTVAAGDCNDDDATIRPGLAEACDGIDQNCDGEVDEGAVGPVRYADFDGDGFGTDRFTVESCVASSGWVDQTGDCSDLDPTAFPGAEESCDGVDDDCDGNIDEDGVDAPTWYADRDGDGHGDPDAATIACAAPPGAVASFDDCDDTRSGTRPGAVETCDGRDEDCDGTVDDGAFGAGKEPACPATSCAGSLAAQGGVAPDGRYWVDPDGTGAFESWCDMTTDGGGWTLVWKMHHLSRHENDGPADPSFLACDMDPLDEDNAGEECNLPSKWTLFRPTDLRIVSAAFTFTDPVDYDYVYTEPTDALDDSDDILPYTAAAHFVAIADNCPGSEGIPPTTDTAPGYWLDKYSPGVSGNWDIDLRESKFDANCSRLGYGGPGGYATATTFLYVR